MKKSELKRKLDEAEQRAEHLERKLMDSIILGCKIAEAYGIEIGLPGDQVIMAIASKGQADALVG